MIKNALLFLLLMLSFLAFSACTSGPKADRIDLDEDLKCTQDGASAPEWVCGNVEHEAMQIAIGKAAQSKIGRSFTLREATADGVAKIKRRAQFYVEKKIRKFARMMDPELAQIADDSSQKIAKEISQAEQNDYKQIKEWQNPANGDLFVLVAIQNRWLDQQIREELLALYETDAATWKKFRETDGEDKLDTLFED
ncbi:MAG: hypothetical protein U9Q62_01380 [Campylobacterota bacterium]|nr:hypothetical protein [Campylobacterota bacterium]